MASFNNAVLISNLKFRPPKSAILLFLLYHHVYIAYLICLNELSVMKQKIFSFEFILAEKKAILCQKSSYLRRSSINIVSGIKRTAISIIVVGNHGLLVKVARHDVSLLGTEIPLLFFLKS